MYHTFSVGQTVVSQYFGEARIEEIAGKHFLLRATDGTNRCMYHWTSEFEEIVFPMPFDRLLLTDNYGNQDEVVVLSASIADVYVQFVDGSCLWVSNRHITKTLDSASIAA